MEGSLYYINIEMVSVTDAIGEPISKEERK